MRKFFRAIFWLLLLGAAGATAYGYYKGVRPNDVKDYVNNWIAEWQSNSDGSQESTEEKISTPKPSSSPVKRGKTDSKIDNQLQPLPANPFARIDRHTRNCPKSKEANIPTLAAYLSKKANSDLEKARAIYIWLTDNIRYDDEGFNGSLDGDYSAEGVLDNRIAVCEGFSNLYLALGLEMGLEIRKISGYSKGYGFSISQPLSVNHAWNMIRINGSWRVFDATWGEGNARTVGGKMKSAKEFDNYWFNLDPYAAAFDHLPEEAAWAKVQPAMNLNAFSQIPKVRHGYFEIGFDPKKTYRDLRKQPGLKFPEVFSVATHIEVHEAPPYANLELGQAHEFEFFIPRGIKAALIGPDEEWHYFSRDKGVFSLDFTPKLLGEYKFCIQIESRESYSTLLVYQSANSSAAS